MSDLEKAEELLRKFLDIYDPARFQSQIDQALLLASVRDYFKKPVVISDFNGGKVELTLDDDGDVTFWMSYDIDVTLPGGELVRGLKELGVIE